MQLRLSVIVGFCSITFLLIFVYQLMLKDDRSASIPSENNLVMISSTNSCSQIVQDVDSNNKRPIEIKDDKRIMNRSFIDHPLWYEEKLTHHTDVLPLSKYTNSTKRILAWSRNWNNLPDPFCDDRKDWFRLNGCPVWQCEVVPWDENWKNLNESGIAVEDFDAIVFHDAFWNDPPAKRSPHQRYIFYAFEAPGWHSHLQRWDETANFFNWTMSYRWDSDIVTPYGYTRYLTGAEIRNRTGEIRKKNYAEGKSKFAIWIASNCQAGNGRKDYVDRLQKYVTVDIYGGCGNLTCPRGKQKECREMMGRDYKFVIAFENSFCWDYVSEKYFYNVNYDVIPIVIDFHGNYDRFAPPKSYINAVDFASVEGLANYLKLLDENDELYNEYFWWKEHYVMEYSLHEYELNIYEASARGYCGLCSKLHNPSEPVSIVKNVRKWWNDDATCKVITFPWPNDTWSVRNFT